MYLSGGDNLTIGGEISGGAGIPGHRTAGSQIKSGRDDEGGWSWVPPSGRTVIRLLFGYVFCWSFCYGSLYSVIGFGLGYWTPQ